MTNTLGRRPCSLLSIRLSSLSLLQSSFMNVRTIISFSEDSLTTIVLVLLVMYNLNIKISRELKRTDSHGTGIMCLYFYLQYLRIVIVRRIIGLDYNHQL